MLTLLFACLGLLIFALLFKFVTSDGNFKAPFSYNSDLFIPSWVSFNLLTLLLNLSSFYSLSASVFFFFLVLFPGDFTLVSKKHVKKEEIEDKVFPLLIL